MIKISKRFLNITHELSKIRYNIVISDNNIRIVKNSNEILIEFDIDDWVDMDLTDAFIEALSFQIKQDADDDDISADYVKELKKCLNVFAD